MNDLKADARPRLIHELMPSDGRWRILILAGDIRDSQQMSRLTKLQVLPVAVALVDAINKDVHRDTWCDEVLR